MQHSSRARPVLALLLAGTAVVGGCTDDRASTPADVTVATPPSPADGPDEARRWGDGRALTARVDADADRLVVATTIGVSVVTGDGDPLVLHDGSTSLLAMSPDGQSAAFVTAADRIEIWDLESGRQLSTFDVAADQYSSLTFVSPTDVVAGGGGDVTRFPSDGGTPQRLAEAPADGMLGPVAIASDGTVAVPVGGTRPTVAVWRSGAAAQSVDIGAADGTVLVGVVWSPDQRHLAVVQQPPDQGEAVALWDVTSDAARGTVRIPNYVTAEQVAFQGADRIVIPLPDRLAAFDLDGAELEAAAIPSSEAAEVVALPSSPTIVVTGYDGRMRRWTAGDPMADVAPASANVVDQSVVAGAAELVIVDRLGMIRRLGVSEGREEDAIARYAVGEVNSVAIAPGAESVAIGTSTGAVRILRSSDGTIEQSLDRPEGSVAVVAYAPKERLLATGLGVQIRPEVWNDAVAVTDVTSGRAVTTFGGEQENVAGCSFFRGSLDFSPDGSLLAATSHDYAVQVTSVGGEESNVDVLEPHLGTVLDIEFSPDGSLLATSSEDGTLRIWDVAGMSLRDEFSTIAGGYWALAFTPDGSALAASDISGAIVLLEIETGEPTRSFTGFKSPLGDIEFTPDGTRLVAGTPDNAVAVWSVAEGEIVQRLAGHTMPVTDVAVSDDGTAVASSSQDGTVRYWPLGA